MERQKGCSGSDRCRCRRRGAVKRPLSQLDRFGESEDRWAAASRGEKRVDPQQVQSSSCGVENRRVRRRLCVAGERLMRNDWDGEEAKVVVVVDALVDWRHPRQSASQQATSMQAGGQVGSRLRSV
jgi:hypothetical protein